MRLTLTMFMISLVAEDQTNDDNHQNDGRYNGGQQDGGTMGCGVFVVCRSCEENRNRNSIENCPIVVLCNDACVVRRRQETFLIMHMLPAAQSGFPQITIISVVVCKIEKICLYLGTIVTQ